MTDQPKKAVVKDPVAINLKPSSYQPSKAEIEEEIDMPGGSLDQVRDTFMRPFVVKNS